MKRIELSPLFKRARHEAERIGKNATKQFKRIRNSLKKTISKKRNQRRAIYAGSALTIAVLGCGYLNQTHEVQAKTQVLHHEVQKAERTEQLLNKQHDTTQTLQKTLQTVQQDNTVKETQLKQKADTEAQIKAENEKLKADLQAKREREANEAQVAAQAADVGYGSSPAVAVSSNRVGRGTIPGNGYVEGNCTWYVKSRRADIPNNWGNANAWIGSAQADGWSTGSIAQAGAIGVSFEGFYGHVVFIESVSNDTVNISEMNWEGPGVISSRVVSASSFQYIY